MIIKNKKQMFKLYEKGEFGNKFPCWSSLRSAYESNYVGSFNFRYKGEGSGGFVKYGMNREDMTKEFCTLITVGGIKSSDIHITGGDYGNTNRTLNGEVMWDSSKERLYLHYSTSNKVMREALKESPQNAEGYQVISILKEHLDTNSYNNIMKLLHKYVDHVIEFTCYSEPIGELQWNTVFWEVRQY